MSIKRERYFCKERERKCGREVDGRKGGREVEGKREEEDDDDDDEEKEEIENPVRHFPISSVI